MNESVELICSCNKFFIYLFVAFLERTPTYFMAKYDTHVFEQPHKRMKKDSRGFVAVTFLHLLQSQMRAYHGCRKSYSKIYEDIFLVPEKAPSSNTYTNTQYISLHCCLLLLVGISMNSMENSICLFPFFL